MHVATTPEEIYHPDALDAHTAFRRAARDQSTPFAGQAGTGRRRHQIRVHLALGLPIVGDPLYGQGEPGGPVPACQPADALSRRLILTDALMS